MQSFYLVSSLLRPPSSDPSFLMKFLINFNIFLITSFVTIDQMVDRLLLAVILSLYVLCAEGMSSGSPKCFPGLPFDQVIPGHSQGVAAPDSSFKVEVSGKTVV